MNKTRHEVNRYVLYYKEIKGLDFYTMNLSIYIEKPLFNQSRYSKKLFCKIGTLFTSF